MEIITMEELKTIQGEIKGINWWLNEIQYQSDKRERDTTN